MQCRRHGLCRVGDMAPTCRHVGGFGGKKSPTRCRHHQPRGIALNHWLKAQSEVPSHMWYRPFGNREDRIPVKTQTTCLASFYQGSSEPIAMTTPKKCNKRPFPFASLKNKQRVKYQNSTKQSRNSPSAQLSLLVIHAST